MIVAAPGAATTGVVPSFERLTNFEPSTEQPSARVTVTETSIRLPVPPWKPRDVVPWPETMLPFETAHAYVAPAPALGTEAEESEPSQIGETEVTVDDGSVVEAVQPLTVDIGVRAVPGQSLVAVTRYV